MTLARAFFFALLLLLVPGPSLADLDVTGGNSGEPPPDSTVAALGTCDATLEGASRRVTDATTEATCTSGGGVLTNDCTCRDLAWQVVGAGGAVSDGDKGDITVSSGGTVYQIDAGTVGAPEIATDGVGAPEIATSAVGADEIAAGAVGTSEIATDGVSADELNATGVEAELEAVLDLQDLAGTLDYTPTTSADWTSWSTAPSDAPGAWDRLATGVRALVAALSGRYAAVADVTNGVRWTGITPSLQSNTCLLVQSVLNPFLAQDRPDRVRSVLIVGEATITNAELWDQGGTFPYGLCFGLIPADDAGDATGWLGTYPDAWPDPLQDCGAGAGYQACNTSVYEQPTPRLDIEMQARFTVDTSTGTHGGGASARPIVVLQRGNGYLAGPEAAAGTLSSGAFNSFGSWTGHLTIYFEDDSDGGLTQGTHLALDREGLITATRTGATQGTAAVGIFDHSYLRHSDYMTVIVEGTFAGTGDPWSGDMDNIGLIRLNTWGSPLLGKYSLHRLALGAAFYGNVGTTILEPYIETNAKNVQMGDAVNGGNAVYYASCGEGEGGVEHTCTNGDLGTSGLKIVGGIIEDAPYGLLHGYDVGEGNWLTQVHFENGGDPSTFVRGDQIGIGMGVCSDSGAVWRACSKTGVVAQCGSGTTVCTYPTGRQIDFIGFHGGLIPSDGTGAGSATWGGLRLGGGATTNGGIVLVQDAAVGCSWADLDGDAAVDTDEEQWFEWDHTTPVSNVEVWWNTNSISGPVNCVPPHTISPRVGYGGLRSESERELVFSVDEAGDATHSPHVVAEDCAPRAQQVADDPPAKDTVDSRRFCRVPTYSNYTIFTRVVCSLADVTGWSAGTLWVEPYDVLNARYVGLQLQIAQAGAAAGDQYANTGGAWVGPTGASAAGGWELGVRSVPTGTNPAHRWTCAARYFEQ